MKNLLKNSLLVFAVLFLFASLPVSAAERNAELQPVDFSCKGVYLGDSAAKLLQAFGTPLFEKDVTVQGIQVRYYTFPHDFTAGVAVKRDRVVDFKIRNQQYEARNGVKYGATAYKIKQTYGKQQRTFFDGATYYIYENPEHKYQRLLIEAEPTDGWLLSMRITNLPLTDEEAENMAEDSDWENNDLTAITMADKPVDTSALDKQADKGEVKLEIKG